MIINDQFWFRNDRCEPRRFSGYLFWRFCVAAFLQSSCLEIRTFSSFPQIFLMEIQSSLHVSGLNCESKTRKQKRKYKNIQKPRKQKKNKCYTVMKTMVSSVQKAKQVPEFQKRDEKGIFWETRVLHRFHIKGWLLRNPCFIWVLHGLGTLPSLLIIIDY